MAAMASLFLPLEVLFVEFDACDNLALLHFAVAGGLGEPLGRLVPFLELLLHLLFLFVELVGGERDLRLIQLFEHEGGLHVVCMRHLEVRLLDRRLVHPALPRVLHVGRLIELVRLFVDRGHVVGQVACFFAGSGHLIERAALDRHLRLEFAPLRTVHLGGLLEDELFRRELICVLGRHPLNYWLLRGHPDRVPNRWGVVYLGRLGTRHQRLLHAGRVSFLDIVLAARAIPRRLL